MPFNTVLDKIFEIKKVINIPSKITNKTVRVDKIEAPKPIPNPQIKIEEIVINKGNLPLHGTKAFVRIAINFSLVELIILQPTTPAALQPKPMHMVVTNLYSIKQILKEIMINKIHSWDGEYEKMKYL